MDLYESTWKYFSAFESKDLDTLRDLYSDTVSLVDWDVECHSAEKVLQANESLFGSVGNIKVDITRCSVDKMLLTATAEIIITLDGEEIIVADIITFGQDGKIKNIRAYKG
tara:strand:+ start:295 stop:627 length:333 start_codon:yes stop_codon:yes gene_type:complete